MFRVLCSMLQSSSSFYYFERYIAYYLTLTENGTIDEEIEMELVIEMACKVPTVRLIQKDTTDKVSSL